MGQTLSRKDRILNGDKVAFPTASEQILMKHVAEGGGSGGMQLEQIGTTHDVAWIGGGLGSKLKIAYYRIGGENSNLFAIQINGRGANKNVTPGGVITLDEHSNVNNIENLDGGVNSPQTIAACGVNSDLTGSAHGTFEMFATNGYLLLKNAGNAVDVATISGISLFIGKLADNIT